MSGYGFNNIYLELSVENILRVVSDSMLWRFYFGQDFELKKNYVSPLRKEEKPSFNLFEDKRERVMFKDFGGAYGDIFEFLQQRDFLTFREALVRVNVDFNLRLGTPAEQSYNGSKPMGVRMQNTLGKFEENFKIQTAPVINAVVRKGTREDLDYWLGYGITEQALNNYDVHCVSKVRINGALVYTYDPTNPCYGYYFKVSKHIKLYFPFAKEDQPRFLGNANNYDDIQGYYQCDVKKGNQLLILTKSMKDVMCLRGMGYEAMAIHGEGQYFYPDFIRHIRKYYPKIISLYDRDKTGVKGARYLWKKYKIPAYFVPKSFTNAKDISDVRKLYGKESAEELMKKITQT